MCEIGKARCSYYACHGISGNRNPKTFSCSHLTCFGFLFLIQLSQILSILTFGGEGGVLKKVYSSLSSSNLDMWFVNSPENWEPSWTTTRSPHLGLFQKKWNSRTFLFFFLRNHLTGCEIFVLGKLRGGQARGEVVRMGVDGPRNFQLVPGRLLMWRPSVPSRPSWRLPPTVACLPALSGPLALGVSRVSVVYPSLLLQEAKGRTAMVPGVGMHWHSFTKASVWWDRLGGVF